ncbi:MAG: hypothetical protein AAFY88_31325, partial [Acidobacteriota bacterium]
MEAKTSPWRGQIAAAALLLLTASTPAWSAPEAEATDLAKLQGEWVGRGPGGGYTVTITGTSLRYAQPTVPGRDPFWYETTFTVFADVEPPRLYATITANSTPTQADVGRVVVA